MGAQRGTLTILFVKLDSESKLPRRSQRSKAAETTARLTASASASYTSFGRPRSTSGAEEVEIVKEEVVQVLGEQSRDIGEEGTREGSATQVNETEGNEDQVGWDNLPGIIDEESPVLVEKQGEQELEPDVEGSSSRDKGKQSADSGMSTLAYAIFPGSYPNYYAPAPTPPTQGKVRNIAARFENNNRTPAQQSVHPSEGEFQTPGEGVDPAQTQIAASTSSHRSENSSQNQDQPRSATVGPGQPVFDNGENLFAAADAATNEANIVLHETQQFLQEDFPLRHSPQERNNFRGRFNHRGGPQNNRRRTPRANRVERFHQAAIEQPPHPAVFYNPDLPEFIPYRHPNHPNHQQQQRPRSPQMQNRHQNQRRGGDPTLDAFHVLSTELGKALGTSNLTIIIKPQFSGSGKPTAPEFLANVKSELERVVARGRVDTVDDALQFLDSKSFAGNGLDWFNDEPIERYETFDEWSSRFRKRFTGTDVSDDLRRVAVSRIQREKSEGIRDFAQRLKREARQANLNLSDQEMKTYLVGGLTREKQKRITTSRVEGKEWNSPNLDFATLVEWIDNRVGSSGGKPDLDGLVKKEDFKNFEVKLEEVIAAVTKAGAEGKKAASYGAKLASINIAEEELPDLLSNIPEEVFAAELQRRYPNRYHPESNGPSERSDWRGKQQRSYQTPYTPPETPPNTTPPVTDYSRFEEQNRDNAAAIAKLTEAIQKLSTSTPAPSETAPAPRNPLSSPQPDPKEIICYECGRRRHFAYQKICDMLDHEEPVPGFRRGG